jgi:hypothetical protein
MQSSREEEDRDDAPLLGIPKPASSNQRQPDAGYFSCIANLVSSRIGLLHIHYITCPTPTEQHNP